MAGVTEPAFRNRLRRNGCARLFTGMVSANALARKNARTAEYLRAPDVGGDLAVQLFGAEPDALAEAAWMAQDAGFRRVDFNMGCPVRKVVRSGAGAALLADLDRAERCVRALRRAVRGVLSVKLRLGWDPASITCEAIARMAEDCGVDEVTLHGRTRSQGYSGRADWSWVARLARMLAVPVIGNGDVDTAAAAILQVQQCGCAGVMIGRAALARPWIFGEIEASLLGRPASPARTPAGVGEDLILQMEDAIRWKGARIALFEMRKFVAWAARGLAGAAEFRRGIQGVRDAGAMQDEIRRFFGARSALPETTARMGWEETDAEIRGAP